MSLLLILARGAFAHGDLDGQIAAMTGRIQQQPADANLRLARAELHRLHRDWPNAAIDYDEAGRLAPVLSQVHFGRGQMLLEAGRFGEAAMELDLFLEKNPKHADGLLARARAEMKGSDFAAAAEDFTRAIQWSGRPEPEVYLEHAQAVAALGDDRIADAVRVLDEGIQRLGLQPALGLAAVELEAKAGQFDAALTRLGHLAGLSKRKEAWHARRAEMLVRAGRPDVARLYFQAALDAIELLPPHIRGTRAMTGLAEQMREGLASLKAPAP